jgi:hypothetical protein
LSNYLRGGSLVKNIYTNRNIPGVPGIVGPTYPSTPICLTSFYGASHFLFSVKFEADAETKHKYGWNNDGKLKVYVWGVSDNFEVTISGKGVNSSYRIIGPNATVTDSINNNGGVATFNNLNTGTYSVTVADKTHHQSAPSSYKTHLKFSVKINYNTSPGGSVNGFSLDTRYDFDVAGTPGVPPPPPIVPPLPPPNIGLETFDSIQLESFNGDTLSNF